MRWAIDNGPALVVLSGAMLSAVGAFWTARNQGVSREATRVQAEQLAAQTAEISDLQKQMTAKADEAAELQRQLHGYDSFCYVSGGIFGRGQARFQLTHKGKYPLHGLRVTAFYLNPMRSLYTGTDNPTEIRGESTLEEMQLALRGIEKVVGDVAPGEVPIVMTLPLRREVSHYYRFVFRAANGEWSEDYYFRSDTGKAAIRVLRNGTAVVDEGFDAFPKTPAGEVEW
jgi:uncharacterized protein YegP (UPF0339 family)